MGGPVLGTGRSSCSGGRSSDQACPPLILGSAAAYAPKYTGGGGVRRRGRSNINLSFSALKTEQFTARKFQI